MHARRSVNDYHYVLSDFLFRVVTFLQANTSVTQDHEELGPDGSSVQDKLFRFNSFPTR